MELVKFSNMLGGSDPASPPFRIPARDLDRNFSMLKPLRTDGNARQYLLTETPEGWSIKIFPDFPSGEGPFFLAFANGRLYWTGSNVDEPEDSQGLQLVEVERCDGKRMKVLGTGWYDP